MRKSLAPAITVLIYAVFLPVGAQTGSVPTPDTTHPSLRDRLKELTERVTDEESSRKISGKKAGDLRAQILQARKEFREDIKANQKKPLTEDQTKRIEEKLDAISSQL